MELLEFGNLEHGSFVMVLLDGGLESTGCEQPCVLQQLHEPVLRNARLGIVLHSTRHRVFGVPEAWAKCDVECEPWLSSERPQTELQTEKTNRRHTYHQGSAHAV